MFFHEVSIPITQSSERQVPQHAVGNHVDELSLRREGARRQEERPEPVGRSHISRLAEEMLAKTMELGRGSIQPIETYTPVIHADQPKLITRLKVDEAMAITKGAQHFVYRSRRCH
jgi:hypothetical protein